MANNLAAIQRALEDAGVEFIPENGGSWRAPPEGSGHARSARRTISRHFGQVRAASKTRDTEGRSGKRCCCF